MDVLNRFLERLCCLDLWAAGAIIYAFGVNLCGPNYWPMVLLVLLLIFCDTLTRWDCIVKQYILDHDQNEDDVRLIKLSRVFVQFFRPETWSEGYLTSRAFSRICEKMLIYGLSLTIFFIAGQWLPEFHLFGIDVLPKNVFPGTITMVLFLIEISSINENLIELGYNGVSEYVQRIIDGVLDRIAPKKKEEK